MLDDLKANERLPSFQHQLEIVQRIVQQPFFFNASEMGTGKTKVAIDACQLLYLKQQIDRVIVICPASVRSVWYDVELGELHKHLWSQTSADVIEFHRREREWHSGPKQDPALQIIVTNYEFIRLGHRLDELLPLCTPQTMLILDESSSIKSHTSAQFKACLKLRKRCGRVLLLSGTPIANNPLDLFAQGNMLSSNILNCKYLLEFKARYAIEQPVMMRGGKPLLTPHGRPIQKIVDWQHIDDLQRRFAPYIIRRLKEDCLDLPPKLDPVTLTATLTETTWASYVAMRDEMVVALSSGDYSIAQQAITKIIRLSQITSGFIGGIEDLGLTDDAPRQPEPAHEISREKLDVLLNWLEARLEEDQHFKLLVGCRFRFELARAAHALAEKYPHMRVGQIRGEQSTSERADALRLLDPRTTPNDQPIVVLMTSAGSLGLNLTATSTFIRLSRDFSLFQSLQSDDRVHRPGQTKPVSYFDIMAEGPRGQSTVDRVILQAVRDKRNLADLTASSWVSALVS